MSGCLDAEHDPGAAVLMGDHGCAARKAVTGARQKRSDPVVALATSFLEIGCAIVHLGAFAKKRMAVAEVMNLIARDRRGPARWARPRQRASIHDPLANVACRYMLCRPPRRADERSQAAGLGKRQVKGEMALNTHDIGGQRPQAVCVAERVGRPPLQAVGRKACGSLISSGPQLEDKGSCQCERVSRVGCLQCDRHAGRREAMRR